MKVKFTHKLTGKSVIIDNTGAKSNLNIKISTEDPNLLIIFNRDLKIDHDINNLPEYEKKFINIETGKLDTFSDEYFKEILIPSKEKFFNVEIE